MTGCSSKSAEKPPQNPQVTIDSSSVTSHLTPVVPEPTLDPPTPSFSKMAPKQVENGAKIAKTTPIPRVSNPPKALEFGVPIPWEETPPAKLAAPWTPIPAVATTATIAIVRLDPHSIIVAANRGQFRTAFVVSGIEGFRIQRHKGSEFADAVFATCSDGSEVGVGFFAAYKSWTAQEHPGTYTLFPLTTVDSGCTPLSNTD